MVLVPQNKGLEVRGIVPKQELRNWIAKFIYLELDRTYRLMLPYMRHELLYGVPFGPTLPPKLLGILQVSSQEPQVL